ncbi:signal peptidase I [Calderihabitans maritimus]|uniref:Signal peptidase I n=1 Tax=Calderihabitans maritimus TaxID=1246530 RepID=A0A1Z5HU75_9FIRM|nr:signal peptidase I [Calderihabitans maritimus]GAW92830.1 signal peptidase I [Calderihabitans maritimus]
MKGNQRLWHNLTEILQTVAIALMLSFIIRLFLFQPFYIPSSSMEPTLRPGDRILVNKFIYHFQKPRRGDVIVFRFPLDPQRDFIKRIIAFGGETLEVKNNQVFIDGRKLEEPYLPPDIRFGNYGPVTIPEGYYFVMGDNRSHSQDSRFWGPLNRKYIIGKAVLIFWPWFRAGLIR